MIEDLFAIEKQTYRDSFLHRLDARVKLAITFAAVLAVVAYPFDRSLYTLGMVFLFAFAVLWVVSRLSPAVYAKRLAVILPVGLAIVLFQCFVQNRYYPSFHAILDLPFGIHVYAESVEFASFLFVKFFISVSFVILLSSTTKAQDMLEDAGRLGLPKEFVLAMGMMIRYLFVFGYMFRKINQSLETRCFDPFDHRLPYRYRLHQLGYTIGTLFIRSYEQGERTYTSMLCRGYGRESHCYLDSKPLRLAEWAFLWISLVFMAGSALAVYALR